MTLQIPSQPSVLVVGSGAREHALVWKLAQSEKRPRLFAAPGNPGMAKLAECVSIAADDVTQLVQFAVEEQVDMVVVGPEVPLSLGLADECEAAGIRVFGPVRAAARLESSKAFAKEVMVAAGIPTARHETFTDADTARAFVASHGTPIVIKADGLAAGKGVVVAQTHTEAESAIADLMVGRKFGASGACVVIEECLVGEEVSMMFFVDGQTARPLLPARDYKRIGEGDTGANTGGMGAFAPVPTSFLPVDVAEIQTRIVQPLLRELARRGIVYRGVLYAGLMMTSDGPQVIEFNCRFGDPETEVVLPLLESDLLDVLWATAEGCLAEVDVQWSDQSCVGVVLAAAGYPEKPRTGTLIRGLAPDTPVFHAGTQRTPDGLETSGGRVLFIYGVGDSLEAARRMAYDEVETIYFEGMQFRRDIACL